MVTAPFQCSQPSTSIAFADTASLVSDDWCRPCAAQISSTQHPRIASRLSLFELTMKGAMVGRVASIASAFAKQRDDVVHAQNVLQWHREVRRPAFQNPSLQKNAQRLHRIASQNVVVASFWLCGKSCRSVCTSNSASSKRVKEKQMELFNLGPRNDLF